MAAPGRAQFEVQLNKGGRSVMHEVMPTEESARRKAADLLALKTTEGVRIVKESIFGSGDKESRRETEIFKQLKDVSKDEDFSITPVNDAPLCEKAADYYQTAARTTMARLQEVCGMQRLVLDSKLPERLRDPTAAKFDEIVSDYIISQGVIERLDDKRLAFRERATRLVTFCTSGVLTVGRAPSRATTLSRTCAVRISSRRSRKTSPSPPTRKRPSRNSKASCPKPASTLGASGPVLTFASRFGGRLANVRTKEPLAIHRV